MDIFEILKEDKNSDIDFLKSKCQKLIKEHHPDKNLGQESDTFLKVMKVWKILNDTKKFEEVKSIKMTKSKANWDTIHAIWLYKDHGKSFSTSGPYIFPKF